MPVGAAQATVGGAGQAQPPWGRPSASAFRRVAAVAAVAGLMVWPAVYSGYPLLYPDSMAYLHDGIRVAQALARGPVPVSYWGRALVWCLTILPLHLKISAWPIVGASALVIAWVLWLVVRSIVPGRAVGGYLAVVAPLCALTGVGWFVSYVMPDILGPVLYLCLYLMAFAWDGLRRGERVGVAGIAWWGAVAHSSHLLLAGGVCLLILVVMLWQRRPVRQWLGALGRVVAVVAAAALAQVALHTYLYGRPSLNGKRPPFVMARMIADGPGRWYLEQHWGELGLPNCPDAAHLPDTTHGFLWAPRSIWRSATDAQQDELCRREWPVVWGTVRTYPWAELRLSAGHFWGQLHTFGLYDFAPHPWIVEMLDAVLPRDRARYLSSRQAEGRLHERVFTGVQKWTVVASVGVIVVVGGLMLRGAWSRRLAELGCVIGCAVIGNAAVTGALSAVVGRYQGRVIWLVPLLAGLVVAEWVMRRGRAGAAGVDPVTGKAPACSGPSHDGATG